MGTISGSENLVRFIEYNPFYLSIAGIEPRDLLVKLRALGFVVRVIDEASHRLRPPTSEDLKCRDESRYANLYCVLGSARSRI